MAESEFDFQFIISCVPVLVDAWRDGVSVAREREREID